MLETQSKDGSRHAAFCGQNEFTNKTKKAGHLSMPGLE
jgi:hypothetical protein